VAGRLGPHFLELASEVSEGGARWATALFTGLFRPPWLRPQRSARVVDQHELTRAKVVKVRKLDYTTTGTVRSGTHFFCVPKGNSDIRMVYNGTGCGFNANVWAPRFGLPTVMNTLPSLLPG
jgi:hypothetical protein